MVRSKFLSFYFLQIILTFLEANDEPIEFLSYTPKINLLVDYNLHLLSDVF